MAGPVSDCKIYLAQLLLQLLCNSLQALIISYTTAQQSILESGRFPRRAELGIVRYPTSALIPGLEAAGKLIMVGPDKFGSIPSPLLCFIANFLGGVAKPFFNSGSVSMLSHCNAKNETVQFLVCYF